MNFERLDRITITEPEMKQLMYWKDLNKDLVRAHNTIVQEGLILIGGHSSTIYFNYADEIYIDFKYFVLEACLIKFRYSKRTGIIHELEFKGEHFLFQSILKEGNHTLSNIKHEFIKDIITVTSTIMAYMENYKANVVERKERYTRLPNKSSKKSNKSKKKASVVKLHRKAYIVSVRAADLVSVAKRSYERQIEAWTVKGHPRHYKNGKIVWIKPYSKGKKGGEITPKTYKFD